MQTRQTGCWMLNLLLPCARWCSIWILQPAHTVTNNSQRGPSVMAGNAATTHIGTIALLKQGVKAFRLLYTSRVSDRKRERGNVGQNEFAYLLHSQPRPEEELRRNHQ
jgi:hypothetical protein